MKATVGDFDKKFSVPTDIKIRFAGEFIAIVNDEIVAPDSTIERTFSSKMNKGDKLEIQTMGRWTMTQDEKKFSGEKANPVSMVEIVPDGELSMLERYKAEMMGYISNFAESRGYETEEEANDFDFEDDDDNLIDTPYEYQDMMQEFPINEQEIEENVTESSTDENNELEISEPKTD